jgi:hypothetical protein
LSIFFFGSSSGFLKSKNLHKFSEQRFFFIVENFAKFRQNFSDEFRNKLGVLGLVCCFGEEDFLECFVGRNLQLF